MTDPLTTNYLIVGAILFVLGMIGFLTRRNLIIMFLSVEMMLQGVALNLVAFDRLHGGFDGQILVIFIITVAACEAAVAMALVLALFRSRPTLDPTVWHELGDPGVPAERTEDELAQDPST